MQRNRKIPANRMAAKGSKCYLILTEVNRSAPKAAGFNPSGEAKRWNARDPCVTATSSMGRLAAR